MINEEQFERKYVKVRKHRGKCPKWGKSFCLECFGGGLSRFCEV